MANVNLGLDEIIQSQKNKNRGGNRVGRRRSNVGGKPARFARGARNENYFSDVSQPNFYRNQ